MLETIRRSIGVRWSKFHYRKTRDRIIPFGNAVSSARQVLLILPLNRRDSFPSVMMIDMIRGMVPEESITIVSSNRGLDVMRMLPHSQFINILPGEINTVFLPRNDLLTRIKKKQYDLTIDLNLDLVLPSAYICKETDARVRVGFARKHADTFYNFQINIDPTLDRKLVYERLVRCLQMF